MLIIFVNNKINIYFFHFSGIFLEHKCLKYVAHLTYSDSIACCFQNHRCHRRVNQIGIVPASLCECNVSIIREYSKEYI